MAVRNRVGKVPFFSVTKTFTGEHGHSVDQATYTAVSCEKPEDFTREGYRMQAGQNGVAGGCVAMVVVTMYNEDEIELQTTLEGVVRNHQQL